jgi:hypothetical protein
MKNSTLFSVAKNSLLVFLFGFSMRLSAQMAAPAKDDFWKKVQFGGAVGASFGSGFTDVTLAPGAIYNFNPYVAAGIGLQGSYIRVKNNYESYIYGGSLIGIVNPADFLQLSAELEQVRVNRTYSGFNDSGNFWNTALFIGAGFRTQNVTVGARYNVLYNKSDQVYSDPFMPFIRVYF